MEQLTEFLSNNPTLALWLVGGTSLVEYLMGCTSKIHSNSLVELGLRTIGKGAILFLPKNWVSAKKNAIRK